jgi:hypothetical protein
MLPGALLDRRMFRGRFGRRSGDLGIRVLLGLNTGLHDIHRTGNHTSHSTGGCRSQYLQAESDVSRPNPFFGQSTFLFVESKLKGGERKVTVDGGPVPVEECGVSLLSDDCTERIPGGAVIISRVEVRVVVASLELQSRLQDF